ncbi:MAG: PIN domain-containing protein [Candidatus Brockarchaeota archaeon]|nr:PIN domain-containing protein [Candidatus Brockarchaeota archaeon]
MIYLNTNVIISYVDELDPKHDDAIRLLNTLKGDRLVSRLTLLELVSVFSRADSDNPMAFALYSIEKTGAKVKDIDFNTMVDEALKLAQELKLKTLDLLHLAACVEIRSELFATFEENVLSKSEDIYRLLKIKVVTSRSRAKAS